MVQVLIAVIITLIVTALVVWFLASAYHKKVSEAKIGSAEDKAREIIDEALKTAETKKREALLEVKEESIRTKNELDKEVKVVRRLSVMRAEFSRRKKQSIRNQMQLRKRKQIWLQGKRNFPSREKRFPS